MLNQFGDLERCALRPGNVHSADGWRGVLEPVMARHRNTMRRRFFRGDAVYANPDTYEFLEAEGYKYTIRRPANAVLQGRIGWRLLRPVVARRMRCAAIAPPSATKPARGAEPAVLWLRSSGTPASCFRVSGSS